MTISRTDDSILTTIHNMIDVKQRDVGIVSKENSACNAEVFVDENGNPTGHVFYDLTNPEVGKWEPPTKENPCGRLSLRVVGLTKIAADLEAKRLVYPNARVNVDAAKLVEKTDERAAKAEKIRKLQEELVDMDAEITDLGAKVLGVAG